MKTRLITLALLAGSTVFAGPRVFIGVGVGRYYPPPPVVAYARPSCPGPGYVWVNGYWYPVGGRRFWHAGYWTRPPYRGAYWVAPRYEGRRYFRGYWGR